MVAVEVQFEEGGLGRRIYWKLGEMRGELFRQLGQAFRHIRGGRHVPIANCVPLSSFPIIHSQAF